ncbi:sensor histidine kinase [Piscinibacter sakaiensis]|uniref:histidine kinase n=1 Tax=Piscinibacter sakaiensis TaxID=1547922 RepID=A0A0K8NU09_PISS1|nr:sensor histidine kinase [Piscinibacter sakaiensis]GAP33901.1 hypothetical protein ISF6_1679 [Piscinibacter sakaiensis]
MTPAAAPREAPSGGRALATRLLLAAAAWIVLALALVAWVLVGLFRQHVEQELASRMQDQLDELVAALRVLPAPPTAAAGPAPASTSASAPVTSFPPSLPSTSPAGTSSSAEAAGPRLRLEREPADPRLQQPYGGVYWLVKPPAGPLLRSRSTWDAVPALPWEAAPADGTLRVERPGPRGQTLVFWLRRVELPGLEAPIGVAAGADVAHLERLTRSYGRTLAASLAVLALALVAAAWLQVRLGLAPLRRLRAALARLRGGAAARIEGRHPAEVQPLVDDLNGLLADNTALVEDARRQTGNLAHALKTPLAVLANAAAAPGGVAPAVLDEQLAAMHRQVERHLARARASAGLRGRGPSAGPSTPLAPVLEGLARTLARLHAGRGLALQLAPPGLDGLRLRAAPDELQEMLGNLLDNACQWARGQVRLRLADDAPPGQVALCVDDDGPGIAADLREAVLQRGRRLDERRPGSGLGLAIADDLARLHGGRLRLDDGPDGGLRARLELPRAAVAATDGRR